LLSFIEDSKGKKKKKNSKKNKKKKDDKDDKEDNISGSVSPVPGPDAEAEDDKLSTRSSNGSQDDEEEDLAMMSADGTELEYEEEDDIDPEMRAALDREVEEFRQRLESMNSKNVRNSYKIFANFVIEQS
jgi:hypothetical protein